MPLRLKTFKKKQGFIHVMFRFCQSNTMTINATSTIPKQCVQTHTSFKCLPFALAPVAHPASSSKDISVACTVIGWRFLPCRKNFLRKNRGMSPAGLGSLSWVYNPRAWYLYKIEDWTIDKWWPTFTSLTFVFNCILSWPIIRVEPHLHGRFFCQTTCGHWNCGTVFLLEHLHDLQDVSEISSHQHHASFVSQR